MQFRILLGCLAIVVSGCSSTATRTDPESGAALQRVIADDHRSQADRARDAHRHPQQTRKVATR